MGDATTIVDTYLAMWNETDPKRRAQLIERAWANDGHYADPMLEARGHAALGSVSFHIARDLVTPDGAVVVTDGRLERITGFFGEAPAMAAV